jgi:lysophospholipase L1-like esterase
MNRRHTLLYCILATLLLAVTADAQSLYHKNSRVALFDNCASPVAYDLVTASLNRHPVVANTDRDRQGTFYLKNGDHVVFYGDSITEQRLYTSFVETYIVTRFPKLNVTFYHSGVGGDRVSGGWAGKIDPRIDRDVLPYQPTVMTCMLGMNDAGYQPYKDDIFNAYATGYQHIVDRVKAACPGIRMTLIQPSPYDDVTRAPGWDPGYNAVLVRYGEFVKALAQKSGLDVADLNTPVVAMLQKANATDPKLAQKIIPDRVHPGPGGHLIMAEALLKAWYAPSLVAGVEIDAAAKHVTKAENTRVRDLALSGEALTWEQTDDALPLPLPMSDTALALAVHSSDVVEALDQEPLKVTGLSGARYRLKIDGEDVGTFTKEDLEAGVNLAMLATPMVKQASDVHALTWKHNDLHQARWRQVQMPLADDKSPAVQRALASLDALDAAIVKEQHAAAQPKPHRYELTPA